MAASSAKSERHERGRLPVVRVILVQDDCVDLAAAVLQEDAYIPADAPAGSNFLQAHGPLEGTSPWPRAIRIRHRDIPADDIFKLEPVPAFIILIPQSYYGLDVRAKEQFQSLVPPLDASNAGILVPKYHTFLEGLVHYGLHPPFGLDVPHNQGLMWNDVYVSYLVQQKVQYDTDSDDVLPRKALLPNEQAVLR
ncbi:hypothetical protein OH76DRAFT_1483138 [Lentinus brumalis]|uniref:Uncharacterized protein n=1 Tax=Lentinus brumalis TaxID=2498619 RepID=A0A371DAB7_9APHY|nr:hypothetical protein OH76DRAFT_1483138 [Polyporus brumalis]